MWPKWGEKNQMGLCGECQASWHNDEIPPYSQLLQKNTPKLQNAMLLALQLHDLLLFREEVDINTGKKNIHS